MGTHEKRAREHARHDIIPRPSPSMTPKPQPSGSEHRETAALTETQMVSISRKMLADAEDLVGRKESDWTEYDSKKHALDFFTRPLTFFTGRKTAIR